MRARQHEDRIQDRAAQNRSWTAPLPDVALLTRSTEAPRMRLEWDTRGTMNNRMWDLQVTGPLKTGGPSAITSADLAAHPTHGANAQTPLSGRTYWTPLTTQQFMPVQQPYVVGQDNAIAQVFNPLSKGIQSSWLAEMNTTGDTVARELRGVLRENPQFRSEDTYARIAERTFQHQWIASEDTNQRVTEQLAAAERLRAGQDDPRISFRPETVGVPPGVSDPVNPY